MYPAVVGALCAMCLNIFVGVPLVLGWPFPNWEGLGFIACPTVTAAVEWLQIIVILVLGRKHVESLWPGWSMSHITRARVKQYLKLYIPAALSIASDFWRFALVGAVAATIGPTDVSTFTASYRIMWLSLMFCGSVAGGVSIILTIA